MKNIIFDIDGTLWDTTAVVAKGWNMAISELGIKDIVITSDILKKEFGKPMDAIADSLFPSINREKREQLLEKCCEYEHLVLEQNNDNLLFPNVRETIVELSKDHSLFIISNCQSGYVELLMEKIQIEEYITDHECFGDTGKSKGENIKLVMERNHLEEAVYVGDTQGDYEATVFAGIPFIFAKYGFGKVENCYLSINNIKELLKL